MTIAPEATPALIPDGESSKTTDFSMGKPRSEAARRKTVGSGLPRVIRGSSAVTQISGIVMLEYDD